MFLYIFFELSLFSLFLVEKKYRKFNFIILLIIMTLFLSTKKPTYYDLINYKNMFESANINNIGIYPEIGFVVIASIFKKIGLSFYFFTTFFYGCMFYFIYKGVLNFTNNYEISFLVFLLFPIFFLSNYIAMRQAVAISLFFYTISLYLNHKKYIVFLLLSLTFHYSVILAYLIFFLTLKVLYNKFNLIIYFLIICLSFIISLIIKSLFSKILLFIPLLNKYTYYFLNDFQTNITRTIVYIGLYFLILFLFYYNRSKNEYTTNASFNLFTIGILITIIGSSNMNINRFANYFMIFLIVLIPKIFMSKNNLINFKQRQFILFLLFILLSIYYYLGIINIKDVFLSYESILL